MKNKKLLITSGLFFLIVQTRQLWEGKIGHFGYPMILILVGVFGILIVAMIRHLTMVAREKPPAKERMMLIGVLVTILSLTLLKPGGLIDFERFEKKDVLVARREGVANCTSILKLKEDLTFVQRSVCFGVTEVKGTYHLHNDTIFFNDVRYGLHADTFCAFAVMTRPKPGTGGRLPGLKCYQSRTDKRGPDMFVTKNEMIHLEN